MGGKALKRVKVERKNLEEYQQIKDDILTSLSAVVTCKALKETPEKENFGDLDVLYLKTDQDIVKIITELFSPQEVVVNGPVVSFDYRQFQIDMIEAVSERDFITKDFYLGYGDFGNILGKLFHNYNLCLGEKGLWISLNNTIDGEPLPIDSNIGKNLMLSDDPESICRFLDYDYHTYLRGFTTKFELFAWLSSSKYFSSHFYLDHNNRGRKDVSKRPNYQQFIEYIQQHCPDQQKAKISLQRAAIDHFGKQSELDQLVHEVQLRKQRKEKFNGSMLDNYHLEYTNINSTITRFQNYIKEKTNQRFFSWVDQVTREEVEKELEIFMTSID